MGGEGAGWEFTEQCFHERVWDRLTAVAERLWSNPPYDEVLILFMLSYLVIIFYIFIYYCY